MILTDMRSDGKQTFSSLNSKLNSVYGISINESTDIKTLASTKKKTVAKINEMKLDNSAINTNKKYGMYILLNEAIDARLADMVSIKHNESKETIAQSIADYVVFQLEIGSSYEKAIDSGMKSYYSSPYIFDGDEIRGMVESKINSLVNQHYGHEDATDTSDDIAPCDVEPDYSQSKELDIMNRPSMRDSIVGEMKKTSSLSEKRVKVVESEVEEAEIIIATKGFSKSLQEMIEKVGRLQNEDLPPLTDQMRANFGNESATVFNEKTQGTLQSVLDSLYFAKEEIDRVVQDMATDSMSWNTDMDSEVEPQPDEDLLDPEMDLDPELDQVSDELPELDDEEPLGRIRKESIQNLAKKMSVLESKIRARKNADK